MESIVDSVKEYYPASNEAARMRHKAKISGIGVYYLDGRETQRIGIVPDIEVKPTIKGIREGRDELLEKAIEIIRQEQK
jgi:C-terminal processing protease CtpA/Prc